MPIYEYRCQKCQRKFEVLFINHEQPPTTCKVCGGGVIRIISPPAIQFKGTGWYVTDYAKKDNAGDGAEKTKTESPKENSSTKTENKQDG